MYACSSSSYEFIVLVDVLNSDMHREKGYGRTATSFVTFFLAQKMLNFPPITWNRSKRQKLQSIGCVKIRKHHILYQRVNPNRLFFNLFLRYFNRFLYLSEFVNDRACICLFFNQMALVKLDKVKRLKFFWSNLE